MEDYSAHAMRVLGRPAKVEDQFQATIKFFSQANQFVRSKKPGLVISNFIYAQLPDAAMQSCASIKGLDYFGNPQTSSRRAAKPTAPNSGPPLCVSARAASGKCS